MDTYKTIFSPSAVELLESYLNYIENEYSAYETARSIYQDALETQKRLETVAGSLGYLKDPALASMGYRKINFKHHRYLMIYRVDGDKAFIVAIYHQSQDYENILMQEDFL